jgi:pilus assembly protein CpaB
VDLVPGEQLLRGRFLEPEALAALSAVEVPEGLHQVSVSLEAQRALGGRLRPGDTVGVIASFTNVEAAEDGQAQGETTHLVLHKVLVTHFDGGAAVDDEDEAASSGGNATEGHVMVTLAVDPTAAERVVLEAEHGSLWLTHEPPEDPDGGTRNPTK